MRALGSAASTTRTAAQTDLARLWVSTASQVWNSLARQLITAKRLGPARAARTLALLHLAMSDAFVASWDAKFAYAQWRPITGIRGADSDQNPRTEAEPAWTPLLPTPPFPDDVAGHTACAGAAETVLVHVFGPTPDVALELTSAAARARRRHGASTQRTDRHSGRAGQLAALNLRRVSDLGGHDAVHQTRRLLEGPAAQG